MDKQARLTSKKSISRFSVYDSHLLNLFKPSHKSMFTIRINPQTIARTLNAVGQSCLPIKSQSISKINAARTISNFWWKSSFHTSSDTLSRYRRFGDSQQSSREPDFSVINRTPQHSKQYQGVQPLFSGRVGGLSRVQQDRKSWYRILLLVVGAGGAYYVFHLEQIESTGRWRFMNMGVEEERMMADMSFKQILQQYQGKILSPNDPITQTVHKVATRIVHAASIQNQQGNINADHLQSSFHQGIHSPSTALSNGQKGQDDVKWQIFVVKDDTPNTFVLPNGKIFVMTGILPICQDVDGIATVLGHEVSHQILRHGAEKISKAKFLLYLGFALDGLLGINIGISNIIFQFIMELPNSRQCETEADHIGLRLMSSACFDPTKAPGLWKRMQEQEKNAGSTISELVSTHPLSSKRMKHMEEWLPEAERIRQNSNCPNPQTVSAFNSSSSLFTASPRSTFSRVPYQ